VGDIEDNIELPSSTLPNRSSAPMFALEPDKDSSEGVGNFMYGTFANKVSHVST
jgi:hypothetical protein